MDDIIKVDLKEKELDNILIEYENTIKQVGIQSIWLIGEQLKKAKEKIIEITNDKRAPGFINWSERKFGFKKMTIARYINAYKNQLKDIKQIWGHKNSVSLAIPNELFLYDIWNIQSGDNKEFFGHFPERFMYNLLYYHTKENDLIYDPFAGSGTTIDICKKMNRRYVCYDRKSSREDIIEWDIKNGIPENINPDLIFLDPPYWKQAENQYSNDKDDLGNMELNDFNNMMFKLLKNIANKRIKKIALIIRPSYIEEKSYKCEEHIFIFDRYLSKYNYIPRARYILPYSTQQYNGNQVNIAKENKYCLILRRDLILWELENE